MVTENGVNIGSGNGLLPDGSKTLAGPMLTCHQWSYVTITEGQFHKRYFSQKSPRDQRVKYMYHVQLLEHIPTA